MTRRTERETSRERFVRLANARVTKAIKAIRIVGNLSNRSNYSYDAKDVAKIVRALEGEIRSLRRRFGDPDAREDEGFRLDG